MPWNRPHLVQQDLNCLKSTNVRVVSDGPPCTTDIPSGLAMRIRSSYQQRQSMGTSWCASTPQAGMVLGQDCMHGMHNPCITVKDSTPPYCAIHMHSTGGWNVDNHLVMEIFSFRIVILLIPRGFLMTYDVCRGFGAEFGKTLVTMQFFAAGSFDNDGDDGINKRDISSDAVVSFSDGKAFSQLASSSKPRQQGNHETVICCCAMRNWSSCRSLHR